VLHCVAVCCSVLQCVAVCCSVLQCVAVCCSVLQCVAGGLNCINWKQKTCWHTNMYVIYYLSQYHLRCNELQWVAMCGSVLQGVAGGRNSIKRTPIHAILLKKCACHTYIKYLYGDHSRQTCQHRSDATHRKPLQHTATYCNTLQHILKISNIPAKPANIEAMQHTVNHCSILQHTATYFNTYLK